MQYNAKSIRPFIGAKNFEISRNFYRDLGFEENILSHNLSVFKSGNQAWGILWHFGEFFNQKE